MNRVTRTAGEGGLEKIVVDHPAAQGEIYLHGAHVTQWKPAAGGAVLFLSPKAVFADGKAIRGGVPVCLPWFGPHPTAKDAPAHGLVRTKTWEPVDVVDDDAGVAVRLRTAVGATDSPYWPHPFAAELTAHFGRTLTITLAVTNTGSHAFAFGEALHSYFRVGDVRAVRVVGLRGAAYLDKMAGSARVREDDEAVVFGQETDRVYVDTTAACTVHDPRLDRRIVIDKAGSRSTVVWNPFPAKAKSQTDLGEENWPAFVCVETANCAEDVVTLAAGATHTMRVVVSIESGDAA